MISLTVARKYARAFLEIGLQEKNYEGLGKELQKIADLLKENKDLQGVLFSVAYPVPMRKAIFQSVTRPLRLSKATLDFVLLLIDRERIDHFPEIVRAYESLADEVARRVRAKVVTAAKLSPELAGALKGQLEAATGREVLLSFEEDPALIGGILTKIGNVIYDGSLKTQLLKVKENLYKE